eukprot:CAMPEP_0198141984 /NCGR_PEP_ID=MMETSP1443-20131203/4888_1 /TAXON_ID=186043 /ORGANISM="Entomoneis sp., Strain CCMP2396" /LENGTH=350 /DNA_ID=CAMNT_0043804893 /DNA_START=307 /DNA_END=1355 /DNA_ORIENTATION=+
MERRPCFYKSPTRNWWLPRKELSELEVGQKLEATIVQELFDGKTGPKIFCEVGVGRCRDKEKWKIVTAMLRMGHRGAKRSVVSKRVARLRKKEHGVFSVYVSRIRPDNDQLEVVLNEDELKKVTDKPTKVSVSSLQAGQEVAGEVVRVEPFGVMVDVGANRVGLLHIKRVSRLMQKYTDKEEGLKKSGLTKGSQVLLQVESVKRKRLFLDFTDAVKGEALRKKKGSTLESGGSLETQTVPSKAATTASSADQSASSSTTVQLPKEQLPKDTPSTSASQASPNQSAPSTTTTTQVNNQLSADEEADWAAYAAMQQGTPSEVDQKDDDAEEEEDYDDNYDEDRDIEDSLGLG